MRRVILLAVLAIALPSAAFASSLDFAFGGNLKTGTASTAGSTSAGDTFTVNSTLFDVNGAAAKGTVQVLTGTLSACGSDLCFTGGTLTVWNGGGGVIFTGSFDGTVSVSGGVTTITANAGGSPVLAGFTFVVSKTGVVSGDFNVIATPEPGTLGLLGTGLIGLAGLVRRRLRG